MISLAHQHSDTLILESIFIINHKVAEVFSIEFNSLTLKQKLHLFVDNSSHLSTFVEFFSTPDSNDTFDNDDNIFDYSLIEPPSRIKAFLDQYL